MLLSYDWIAEFFDGSADEAAERLTAVGLAVEGREERGDGVLFDVEITTNRPDCMNHQGMARELAAACGRTFIPTPAEPPEAKPATSEATSVTIEDPEGCPRYVARVLRGVQVGPSPDWLRERLEALGLRSINNVVDVTNYVLWETGQPLHAFDLDKLEERRIVVRQARAGEELTTLDGEKRELSPGVLVIADARRPVALAGIMGGLDSEVTDSTTEVLLESAHFDPRTVRRGAGPLGLHTDASHRFERGADEGAPATAAARAAELILEVAGGELLAGAVDVRARPLPPLRGRLDLARLHRFAGATIDAETVEGIFRRLGFGVEAEENGFEITVPTWRFYDFVPGPAEGVVWEADLFEEVLRHYGFDRIESSLPSVGPPDAGSSHLHRRRQQVRSRLAAAGLVETISYAFQAESLDAAYPKLLEDGPALPLANPLSNEFAVLRRSLIPNLVGAARFNANRGATAVRLFEVGGLFPGGASEEREAVGVIAGGVVGSPWQGAREIDLFDVKGWVVDLAAGFGRTWEAEEAEWVGVLDGTGARLVDTDGETVGLFGQLADPDTPYPLFVAEALVGGFDVERDPEPVVVPSRFPGIEVDLTLTHSESVPWRELQGAIGSSRPDLLVHFGLKDRYSGAGVPAGAVNTTIAFRYGAEDRSLTHDEVNEAHLELVRGLEQRFGVTS